MSDDDEIHDSEAVLHLAPTAAAPSLARDFLAGFARDHDGVVDECLSDGTLVLSELVTNAVEHAATGLSVHLAATADHLEVAVQDQGPGYPRVLVPDRVRVGGVGLAMVERLADSWGVQVLKAGGKRVWCRLSPRKSAPVPTAA